MTIQTLTLRLEGITAADYLAWVSDPEASAFGLLSVAVAADPLGDAVVARLAWAGPAPAPEVAAPTAGLPLTPGVRAVAAAAAPELRLAA